MSESFSSQDESQPHQQQSQSRKTSHKKQNVKPETDDSFKLVPKIEKGDDQSEIYAKRAWSICTVFTFHFHSIKQDNKQLPEPEIFQTLQSLTQKELLDACLRMLSQQQAATLFSTQLKYLMDVFQPNFSLSALPIRLPPAQAVLTFLSLIEFVSPVIITASADFTDSQLAVAVGYIAGFDVRISGPEAQQRARALLSGLRSSFDREIDRRRNEKGIDFVDADGNEEALEVGGAKERNQLKAIPNMNNRGRAAVEAKDFQEGNTKMSLMEMVHRHKKEGYKKMK